MADLQNLFPSLILKSPLHGMLSKKLVLLTFTGRRSGKAYTTPVGYVRLDDGIGISTDSAWGRNLRGGAPVTVRLQGAARTGTATLIEDEQDAAAVLAAMIKSQPSYAKHAGVAVGAGGTVSDADVLGAVRGGRMSVRVKLE